MTEGSRATKVATVAVAAVVLVAVVVVLLVQGPSRPPPGAGPGEPVTTVPPPPSSGATPTRTEPPPPTPTPPPTAPPTCPTPAPAQLTVMTFNIHFGTAHNGRVELDRIAEEIRGWKPDVVLLQEVDKGRPVSGNLDQAAVLGTRTGLNHVYGGNSRNTGAGPRGNAILTRFPITSATNTHLPMAGGKELRGLLHAQLDVAGVPVSVYASHFDHRGRKARRVQAKTVVQLMAADPLPKLFGGDLNTGPDSRPIAILKGSGLGDSWAVGSGKGATVPADRPGSRIDFILHDGWFTPVQAEVLFSTVSDHRAVWTRMQLQPPPAC
ncbi:MULTISPECIES: endonuclease/exonuclease/phosphatase family protein [unclassified Nocardioides]|uniref:endonuclease/exonuclease/phosphatase family protein n=1 Tax=unclassified Nocardioides TaxID=2615069 RepID=UPI001154781D|nr:MULTISPECIES: endonuclease/exonuclease/phosphatase family protein [unclassified Nocardioides]TQK68568.1 endonuclease/exonuclease/phosphatase family metal-dependent hydrolase [Nocardioides sp. SLBN-35]WGY02137.1 endonuclease/exonuclease/phosphatase family protein [Nocardioides sp. QY071]